MHYDLTFSMHGDKKKSDLCKMCCHQNYSPSTVSVAGILRSREYTIETNISEQVVKTPLH